MIDKNVIALEVAQMVRDATEVLISELEALRAENERLRREIVGLKWELDEDDDFECSTI